MNPDRGNPPNRPATASPAPARSPLRLAAIGLILLLVFGLHAWRTIALFPSWPALLDDRPVISVDHAIHLYHGHFGAKFLREHGTSWGYDPFFMAGYPKTPVYDSSSGPAELFELAAGGFSPRAYKIGVALLVWLALVVVAGATLVVESAGRRTSFDSPNDQRRLQPSVSESFSEALGAATATAFFALWYWWVSFADVLVRTGLVAFVWASALAVLLPAMFVRWSRRPTFTAWCGLTLVAAAGIQAHVTFALMVAAPLAVGYLGAARSHRWRWHAATWAAAAVALAVTAFWWVPLLRFLPLKTRSTIFMQSSIAVFDWLQDYYLFSDARVPLIAMCFGWIGLVALWRSGRRIEVFVMLAQLAVFSLLTFVGSLWLVTRNLEPLRFQVPLALAWCVPAGRGLSVVLAALDPGRIFESGRRRFAWFSAAAMIAFVLAVSFPFTWAWMTYLRGVTRPEMFPKTTWAESVQRFGVARPLAVGLRPEMTALVDWINANTDSSARILFEDQTRLLERNDPADPESIHWTPLLPVLTGREFIGGLYHLAFIPHNRVGFGDWHIADRHIRDFSADELATFCERYNVGWVMTWSRASPMKARSWLHETGPLATEVFAELPFCDKVAELPRHSSRPDENAYTIFRVRREPNFFERGTGRIERVDYNRIELADLKPDDGSVVLRYHWQDGLRAEPPVPIEPIRIPGDPVGFIRIRTAEPIKQLTIENSYR